MRFGSSHVSKRRGLGIAAWRGMGALSEDVGSRKSNETLFVSGTWCFLSFSFRSWVVPSVLLLMASWLQCLQVSHPYLGRRQEEGQGWRGMSSACLLTEGKTKLLWKTHPLNFRLYFYPNLYCWANPGWNVTSEKEIVDESWVKQSSVFVQSLSSGTVEILNKMIYQKGLSCGL